MHNPMDLNELAIRLESAFDQKKRVTVKEFKKFLPLFDMSRAPILDGDDPNYDQGKAFEHQRKHFALAKEWARRTNPQSPIDIVEDATGEVLGTLPPTMIRVSSLNETVGSEKAGALIDAVSNSFDRSTAVRDLTKPKVDLLVRVLQHGKTPEERKEMLMRDKKLAAKITGKEDTADVEEEVTSNKEALKNAKWS